MIFELLMCFYCGMQRMRPAVLLTLNLLIIFGYLIKFPVWFIDDDDDDAVLFTYLGRKLVTGLIPI